MADPKQTEAEQVAADKEKLKNRCPHCGRPWSFGLVGKGTQLEVQCSNRMCKKRFVIMVV